MIFHCARRTTIVSSWGFREHRGLLEPPLLPLMLWEQRDTRVFPISIFLPIGGGPVESPIVRNQQGPSVLPASLKGVAKAALYCAHRTSTFLSCAFCEQEGHLVAPFPLP